MKTLSNLGMVLMFVSVVWATSGVADARSPHCRRHLGRRANVVQQPLVYSSSYAYRAPQVAYYRAPLQSSPVYSGYGYARSSGLGYSGIGIGRMAYPGLGYSSSYRYPSVGLGYGGYGGYGYGGYGYGGYRNYGAGYPGSNLYRGYGYGVGSSLYGPSLGIPGTGLRIGF